VSEVDVAWAPRCAYRSVDDYFARWAARVQHTVRVACWWWIFQRQRVGQPVCRCRLACTEESMKSGRRGRVWPCLASLHDIKTGRSHTASNCCQKQPFSQNSRSATVPKVFQIGLCLQGRRGRFGTLFQQLECGIFGRTAVVPYWPLRLRRGRFPWPLGQGALKA